MTWWALDLGTRNTVLARWDESAGSPRAVRMPRITSPDQGADAVVPSAVDVAPEAGLAATIARLAPFRDALTLAREGTIGAEALARAADPRRSFAVGFKSALRDAPLRAVARRDGADVSAREVTRVFLRELLAEAQRVTLERPRHLVVAAPVDAFEAYRAEVGALLASLGVETVRWVDEPVAAAVGYGVSLRGPRDVLVVDFGAGSLDVVRMRLDADSLAAGEAVVLGKAGRPLGGDTVDRWLLDDHLARRDAREPRDPFALRWLLDEARRVKEALSERDAEPFLLEVAPGAAVRRTPPGDDAAWTPDALRTLLEQHGALATLDAAVDEALAGQPVDDVLLVGGSTRLTAVRAHLAARFGEEVVRSWDPLHAVALGACHLGASGFAPADFVVHDYAIVVHDRHTGEARHQIVVPAGTRFPTPPDLWRRRLVPTCAHGGAEHRFTLEVVELGVDHDAELDLTDPRRLGVPKPRAVSLNGSAPYLGTLDPPHLPDDPLPRLEVTLGVDGDRWLIATVLDLRSGRSLLDRHRVLKLR